MKLLLLAVLLIGTAELTGCAGNTQVKVCHDSAVAIKIATVAAPHLSAKETADVNALIAGLSPACMPKGKQP